MQFSARPGDELMTGRQMWRAIVERRVMVAAMLLVGIVVAITVVLVMKPVYRAEALVSSVDESLDSGLSALAGDLGGLAALAGITPQHSQTMDYIAILQSREIAEEFIRTHNLLPLLFQDDWDAKTGSWKQDVDDPPTMGDAWREFDEDIRGVIEDPRGGLVTVRIDWTDRAAAAAWANDLIRLANDRIRDRSVAEAERGIAYLQKELEQTSTLEIRQGIFRLIEDQIKRITIARMRSEFAFDVLDPAVAPDADDPLRPLPVWYILGGAFGGLAIGVLIALLLGALARLKS